MTRNFAVKPDLAVKYRPVASLVPYARNARTHTPAHVDQIAAAVRQWGWTNPVLVDEDGGIIAGHGRVLAAQKLGLIEVPTITLAGLSEAAKRAYILADNKLALNAGWDEALLVSELQELGAAGFDLGLLGFADLELSGLFARAEAHSGLTDPDSVLEPPAEPASRRGDLWVLGRHRVLCGDATSAADVGRVLGPVKPHLMVTDPPYGVDYDPDWRNRADRANGKPYGARAIGKVTNDERIDWRDAWALFPGAVAYVWHAGRHASDVQASLEPAGFVIRCQIIWAKPRFVISRGDYHWQHEPCWYAVKKGARGEWHGGRSQTTLWEIEHLKSETGHSTQKPVECMRRPIENNSSEGQAVYDPFLGSGTTVIAAEMTARSCLGLEIDPAYCDVIVRRWQEFTGEQAMLDGRTFEQIREARCDQAQAQPRGQEARAGAIPAH